MRSYSVKNKLEIGVLGLWHLGCIYSTVFSDRGFRVVGFDPINDIINNLSNGNPPIFEPGLKDFIDKNLNKNLNFTKNPKEAINKKDYVFITLDVPVDDADVVNLKSLNKLFDYLTKYISANTVVVISSQIPVGTCKRLQDKFKKLKKKAAVVYFPENLRLGVAFRSFLKPERIILGGEKKILEKFIKDFNFSMIPTFLMSLESAEMSKHALNAYLATCISFSSELGDICEKVGAEMDDVVLALKSERRVSPNTPLNPGLGFAGGTLGRDIKTLMSVSKKTSYKPLLMESVYRVNLTRIDYLSKRIQKILGKISGKKIGLLGLTYKPGTNTLRRSMSLELAKSLEKTGAKISAFDPMIKDEINGFEFIDLKNNLNDFFKDSDMSILMTEWPEFQNINPRIATSLVRNKIILDTKNFLKKKKFEKVGFKIYRIGSQ